MQNIQKRKHGIGKKISLAVVALIVTAAVIAGFYIFKPSDQKTAPAQSTSAEKKLNDINLDAPTSDQVKAGNDTKKDTVDQSSGTTSTDKPFATTITAANQNGSLLQIRTLIETLSTSGSCELTLSQGAKSVTRSSGIQAGSSTSTCKGFDVSTSELSTGDWIITINVTVGGQTSTATSTVKIL